jgi:ubiquitin-like 1-activating enzyme E1 B
LGQVTVHVRGETACFECSPKPVPKSHPICTLRDTPDKPIHCIAYATDLLFPRLFSAQSDGKSDLVGLQSAS